MWASGICVIHCILLPVFVLAFPVFGRHYEELEGFWHTAFIGGSVGFFVLAFSMGYKHHKNWQPLALGFIGCVFLGLSYFAEDSLHGPLEVICVVAGGLLLMGGHFWNHHCRQCHHNHSPIEPCNHNH